MVGCGLVGAELAAEVLTAFPGKRVTVLHSDDRVVPEVPPVELAAVEAASGAAESAT